jgi:hypothetical protein
MGRVMCMCSLVCIVRAAMKCGKFEKCTRKRVLIVEKYYLNGTIAPAWNNGEDEERGMRLLLYIQNFINIYVCISCRNTS